MNIHPLNLKEITAHLYLHLKGVGMKDADVQIGNIFIEAGLYGNPGGYETGAIRLPGRVVRVQRYNPKASDRMGAWELDPRERTAVY